MKKPILILILCLFYFCSSELYNDLTNEESHQKNIYGVVVC